MTTEANTDIPTPIIKIRRLAPTMTDIEAVKKDSTDGLFRVAHSRMFSALNNYYIWKHLEISIKVNNEGKEKAEKNVAIINDYGYFLHQIFTSTFKGFIGDLSIFFDSHKYEETFSLDKLISTLEKKILPKELDELTKQIREIKKKHGSKISRILELRNSDVSHQKIAPERQHIIFEEVETLFVAVQEILNLINKNSSDSFTVWNHLESEISKDVQRVLKNLERGEKARLEEIERKYKDS